jgi:hypothetical protein
MKAIALLTAACATAVIAELEQVKPRQANPCRSLKKSDGSFLL